MFKPRGLKALSPAIIWAHGGGGAVALSAKLNNPTCIRFAHIFNCAVFNVEYRLGPEAKCPGGQADQMNAFLHIYRNSSKYGVDQNKIIMGGESGGSWITMGAIYLLIKNSYPLPRMLWLRHSMLSNECGAI